MKEELKKIIAHILISLIQDWKPRKSIANDKYNTELFNLKLNELLGYINKHYVRKEGIDELLEKVLELFVQEPSQKNAVFVSPAQQLRNKANLIETKDKVAREFRQLVDSLIKDKEGK